MQYGAMDYLVPAENAAGMFALARELGFDGVEVNLTRAQLQAEGASRLAELKAASAHTGLAIPALVLGEHNNGGIGSADLAVALAARADIEQAIDWAAALGTPIILVPFFFEGNIDGDEDFARAVAAFRALCPLAEAQGVSLCYEGTLPAARIRALADLIGSPAFGCYFDLANVVWLGMDTPTEIRGLGSLIRQVHMKESLVGPGDVRPGQGRVNYPGSVAALHELGYDSWVVLETPGGTPAQVAEDFAFTRRVFGA